MNEAIAGLLGAGVGVVGTGSVTVFTTLRGEKQRAEDRAAESSRSQAQLDAETERLRMQYAAEEDRWRRERAAARADAELSKLAAERASAYREVVAAAWAWLDVLGVYLDLRRKKSAQGRDHQPVELQGRYTRAVAEVIFVGSQAVVDEAYNARESLAAFAASLGVATRIQGAQGAAFDANQSDMYLRLAENSIDRLVEAVRAERAAPTASS